MKKSNIKNWEKDGNLDKLNESGDIDFRPIDKMMRMNF